MDKLFRKFRNMKREGLFLYFAVGLYLLYTARSIFRSLSEAPEKQAVFIVFIVLFAVCGLFLVLVCGWFLLRAYYLKLYLADLEEEQARLESTEHTALPPKKNTGVDRYLDFMYRLFRIKQ